MIRQVVVIKAEYFLWFLLLPNLFAAIKFVFCQREVSNKWGRIEFCLLRAATIIPVIKHSVNKISNAFGLFICSSFHFDSILPGFRLYMVSQGANISLALRLDLYINCSWSDRIYSYKKKSIGDIYEMEKHAWLPKILTESSILRIKRSSKSPNRRSFVIKICKRN